MITECGRPAVVHMHNQPWGGIHGNQPGGEILPKQILTRVKCTTNLDACCVISCHSLHKQTQ